VWELKEAQAAAEAKLDESLKDFTDSSAQLRMVLEEETRARKEAEARITALTTDQAEYDRLVMQADQLALSKPFCFPSSLISLFLPAAYPHAGSFFLFILSL
jgi:hypothetical protein